MRSFKRSQRIADQIRRDAAEIISPMLQDKTGLLVTVSGVEVTDDLRYAKIFYTVLGDDAGLDRVQKIFEHSTGYIQTELAHRLSIRRMPEISLHYDKSLIDGLRLTALMDKVASETEDNQDDRADKTENN